MNLTFGPAAATRTNPHNSIDKGIAVIASFQIHGDAILVRIGINRISHGGIREFLEGFAGTGEPATGLDADESSRLIRGLEEIGGLDGSGEVLDGHLGVMAAGLQS